MSDQPAVSAAGAPEPVTPPEPQIVSPASTGQSPSQAPDSQALDEIRRELAEIKKAQQSTKDKRLGKLERKQAEIDRALKLNQDYGKMAALAATVDDEYSEPDYAPPPGKVEEPDFDAAYGEFLTKHSVSPDDPDLKEISSRGWVSKEAFLKSLPSEMLKAKNRKAKQAGESVASVVAEGGGTPPASSTEAKLLADYGTELNAARGNPSAIRAIKAKFKAKGLPVEQVVVA